VLATSAADVVVDDSAEELTYGESDLGFCLDVVARARAAAAASSTDRRGFCDLGAGRGAMALGVALAEPQLEEGAGAAEASEVVALEVVPELSAIASAAFAVASDARLLSLQGSFYDHDVRSAHARDPAAERPADPHRSPAQLLRRAVRGAQVVYAYASKFDSADGQHAARPRRGPRLRLTGHPPADPPGKCFASRSACPRPSPPRCAPVRTAGAVASSASSTGVAPCAGERVCGSRWSSPLYPIGGCAMPTGGASPRHRCRGPRPRRARGWGWRVSTVSSHHRAQASRRREGTEEALG